MIRVSEAVLPGHPDKLCDLVAESIVQAAIAVDIDAYAQIEAGIWCDQLWLSGGYAARGATLDVEKIAVDASRKLVDALKNSTCPSQNRMLPPASPTASGAGRAWRRWTSTGASSAR